MLTNDPKEREKQIRRAKEVAPIVTSNMDSLRINSKTEEERRMVEELKGIRANYIKGREKLFDLISSDKKQEAVDYLFGEFRQYQNEYLDKTNAIINYYTDLFNKSSIEAENTYNSQFTLLIVLGLIAVLLAIVLAVIVTRGITKPLNVGVNVAEEIARGNTNVSIEIKGKDETAVLLTAMKGMAETIKSIITEINNSVKMAKDGKLDYRADAGKYQGDFKDLVVGFNSTLDAIIGPLNVAAEYVDRISKGDIPPKITDEYKGDFNEIKNNLNTCIDAINALVADANMLSKAAVEGRLDTRADASKHQGDFRKIVQGVNDTLNAVIGPLNVAAEYIDRISKGDIPPKITDEYKGDFNEIKNNLNLLIDADQRISNILLEVSKGNLNVTINERSSQDILIKSLKTTIKSIQELIDDTEIIANAAEEGKLEVRADIDKHEGAYKELIKSFNNTLNSVITPIKEAGQVLGIMAMGDLTVRMLGDYKGDLSKLKDDINSLADSLNGLIQQVNELVNNTASSAAEISATAESIATASQEQSSQADEVASAVEEMTRTITENALAANKTAEVAKVSGKIATEGGSVVSQTVNKMRDIANVVKNSADNIQKLGESSKQIGEIISVIDDIADQTNLLALNAAIEAARAGEQGRGFAVVADEVRKLAERTTEATKQIAIMIKGIQSETEAAVLAMNKGTAEVTNGIELADKAGQSLQQILNSTQEVIDMINQIAAASEEQSATSEQISKNVTSISQVTSESAKRVEDVAHTAEELAKMTNQLADLMRQFKVDEYSSNMPMRQLSRNRAKQLESKLG
ncbi:MAG TPA: methyl-accepting chemotaxis protein [Candidatus Kapabacteria bacterium]|nr:methyl-accepting chemotaxis protein [Candidatus Kapabacteria bacterium]